MLAEGRRILLSSTFPFFFDGVDNYMVGTQRLKLAGLKGGGGLKETKINEASKHKNSVREGL